MSDDGSAAERAVVRKLARGSLLSRLKRGEQPLKLVAVPRDHVHGDRQRGEALARRALHRRQRDAVAQGPRFRARRRERRRSPSSSRASPGFAISPPRRRARRARGLPKRWSAAGCSRTAPRSTRPGRRICGASGSSSGRPMRPTSCRAATAAIARPCSTRWRAAPGTSKRNADKARGRARPGHRLVRRGRRRAARPGRRAARRARRGGARPGARLGAVRRRRARQPLAVRAGAAGRPARPAARLLSGRQADHSRRDRSRGRRRRSPRFMASRWATARCRAGRAAVPASRRGSTALIEGCGLRARPLRQARGWGYQRHVGARHDPRPRRRAAAAAEDGASRAPPRPSRSNCRTAPSGWSSIAAGPGRCRPICPTSSSQGLRTTAAHSTLVLADTNSTNILRRRLARQGRRGRHHRPQRGQ